ncbi:ABC transporter ATP-binding protein [Priestia megaterium]|uniref:ABC transporter ATP-binding protein n=1 Tax=Priestia megaterium TaxID=1404 RepID=UPI003009580D
MEQIIRTENLTKRYGDHIIVDSLNLDIKEGQIYGFLGPNGAGKTTTIRMLLSLIAPSSGKIEIFGLDLNEHRKKILNQLGAFVDSPYYYGHLTGYENLDVIQKMLGRDNGKILKVLETVGLNQAKDKLVKTYSLGMRQRLGLAFALLNEPKLLILDEPTNGLDPAGIHEIRELLKSLARDKGYTIFLSSHNLNEIELIATHVGMIQNGKMIYQGTLEKVLSQGDYQIEIGTTDNLQASSQLNKHGYSTTKRESLLLTSGSSEDIINMNKLLVNEGIGVDHLYHKKSTLEDIFLSLTSHKKEEIK